MSVKEQYVRTAMLLGEDGVRALSTKRVAVFGVGGVGGHVVEVLARSGVGYIDLIDHDVVAESNINRQLIATYASIGQKKIEVMKKRILSIQPECVVKCYDTFYLPEHCDAFDFSEYDYIVDAIDTVTAKIDLVMQAKHYGVPVISSMGTGNKLDPSKLVYTDLYKTSVCPLAKVMRNELRKRGVESLQVVYSTETARKPMQISVIGRELETSAGEVPRKVTPGSTAFVPASAGLLIGSVVVRQLSGI
ncbi:MAG: tRNA threonylcarbamoyladenosine dehydratase [Lachnospiraceae bacterium]